MFSITKKYFQVRVVVGGLQNELREKDGCSLKNGVGLSLK